MSNRNLLGAVVEHKTERVRIGTFEDVATGSTFVVYEETDIRPVYVVGMRDPYSWVNGTTRLETECGSPCYRCSSAGDLLCVVPDRKDPITLKWIGP